MQIGMSLAGGVAANCRLREVFLDAAMADDRKGYVPRLA